MTGTANYGCPNCGGGPLRQPNPTLPIYVCRDCGKELREVAPS